VYTIHTDLASASYARKHDTIYQNNSHNHTFKVDITNEQETRKSDISHSSANELRKLYGLPRISHKPNVEVIKEIKGMMKEYADEESAVDVIKHSREDVY